MRTSELIELLKMAMSKGGDLDVGISLNGDCWHEVDALVGMKNRITGEKLLVITNDNSGMTGKAPEIEGLYQ